MYPRGSTLARVVLVVLHAGMQWGSVARTMRRILSGVTAFGRRRCRRVGLVMAVWSAPSTISSWVRGLSSELKMGAAVTVRAYRRWAVRYLTVGRRACVMSRPGDVTPSSRPAVPQKKPASYRIPVVLVAGQAWRDGARSRGYRHGRRSLNEYLFCWQCWLPLYSSRESGPTGRRDGRMLVPVPAIASGWCRIRVRRYMYLQGHPIPLPCSSHLAIPDLGGAPSNDGEHGNGRHATSPLFLSCQGRKSVLIWVISSRNILAHAFCLSRVQKHRSFKQPPRH